MDNISKCAQKVHMKAGIYKMHIYITETKAVKPYPPSYPTPLTIKKIFLWGMEEFIQFHRKQLRQNCFCLPSENEVYSKRKKFAPSGSKFFPIRVELFFRRDLVCKKPNRKSRKLSPM